MRYVCDAPGGRTWFRIESEAEAVAESEAMHHAVEKYFRKEYERAAQSFRPVSKVNFEQEIGLKAHIQREMPLFLTLRDDDRHAARDRDAAAERSRGPRLPADHRRSRQRRPVSRARRRGPRAGDSITASRSNARAAIRTAATEAQEPSRGAAIRRPAPRRGERHEPTQGAAAADRRDRLHDGAGRL